MKIEGFHPTTELHDLGDIDPRWEGILSPMYSGAVVRQHIHDQFLDDASTYVDRYQNMDHWKGLLEKARPHLGFEHEDPLAVLDIGSGAGNTVFPTMELYPRARIAATDLSLPLLAALRDRHRASYPTHDCTPIQMNAEGLLFEEGSIDLVVGGSILHHLISPGKTLAECCRVLKPSRGNAVFFEPFELGHKLIALGLEQLIELDSAAGGVRETIEPRVVDLMKALCRDYEVRSRTDRSDPLFEQLDDKWLFTSSYIKRITDLAGFRETTIFPIHDTLEVIFGHTLSTLRLGLGADFVDLPRWASDHLRSIDRKFSDDLQRELLVEGCIILRK